MMQLPLPQSQPAGARIQCLREELRSIGGHGVGDNKCSMYKMTGVSSCSKIKIQQQESRVVAPDRHVIVRRGSGNEDLARA